MCHTSLKFHTIEAYKLVIDKNNKYYNYYYKIIKNDNYVNNTN